MHIALVEIANFRKLSSLRINLSNKKTIFVGANNSGKTSAMIALRHFLLNRPIFSINDFTISHWLKLDEIGQQWEDAALQDVPLPLPVLDPVLPFLDVWLNVADNEVHYVQKLLPNLDWVGGSSGVELRFEPKKPQDLQKEYLVARADARAMKSGSLPTSDESSDTGPNGDAASQQGENAHPKVAIWPERLTDFLQRRLRALFEIRAYILDPQMRLDPEDGVARPQPLPQDAEPLQGEALGGLIRIDEINAQRGFGHLKSTSEDDEVHDLADARGSRKLSEQLRLYYANHLDPFDKPDLSDLRALEAIENAQRAFDLRLRERFSPALCEVEGLGYPGVTDPKLEISTRIRPTDGLNHDAAVQYLIPALATEGEPPSLRLPEDYNGLGYQNLISMIFRLLSFRDAWMRVGKAGKKYALDLDPPPPLHLVLIEEPEAHLHAQVQQVFIRRAYEVLRAHAHLGENPALTTQLIVSTHSSHVAHECDFADLRYFRRIPAQKPGDIPTSRVVNLSEVFGKENETKRFVTRYLKVTHSDLFFADGAILVEGPAERILVPHFVREHGEYKYLSECYLTWLEIGGSHAHKLRPLIDHLGLTTLVITDIDAADADGKAVQPKRNAGQVSRNETLKTWAPSCSVIDELLDKKPHDKIIGNAGSTYAVRVAYQCPVKVDYRKATQVETLANTFEDALIFENLTLFAGLKGTGLIAKFGKALNENNDVVVLGQAMFEVLRTGNKAEFALDLLELEDQKALQMPLYIREGLDWLSSQISRRRQDIIAPGSKGGAK